MTPELTEELHTWMASGRTASVDGTHVWYRVEGRGPTLVCFHGFPTSSWDWHRLLPLLTAHFRVLVFDFPGYGQSVGNFSYSKVNLDVVAVIDFLKERGYQQIVCMGASLGGSACWEAAIVRPELSGLVVIAAPISTTEEEAAEKWRYISDVNRPLLREAMENFDRGHTKPTNPTKDHIMSYPKQEKRSRIIRPLQDEDVGLFGWKDVN